MLQPLPTALNTWKPTEAKGLREDRVCHGNMKTSPCSCLTAGPQQLAETNHIFSTAGEHFTANPAVQPPSHFEKEEKRGFFSKYSCNYLSKKDFRLLHLVLKRQKPKTFIYQITLTPVVALKNPA